MDRRKRFIIFLTVVFGILFILFLIFGSGTKKNTAPSAAPQKPLTVRDYTNRDSRMVYTVEGNVRGNNMYRAVRTTVSRDYRLIEVIEGYQNNVIKSQKEANNQEAYATFLAAIESKGYGKERRTNKTDDEGVCPLGQKFVYEIYDGQKQVQRFWGTSCGGQGTSGANNPIVRVLFDRQITNRDRFMFNIVI
jgi:hypothetical protein